MVKENTVFATLKSDDIYANITTSFIWDKPWDDDKIRRFAITKICNKNGWGAYELKKYSYNRITITKGEEGFALDMYETDKELTVIMKNGLPIGIAPNEQQAKKVITQLKADKNNPPGIYNIHNVSQWVSEKKINNGYFKKKEAK